MTKLSGTILALLLTTSAVRAQGPLPQCSQATLNGTYVNSGAGTLGGVSVVCRSRLFIEPSPVPGVYTVNPDCTGSKTFGGATDYDFVVTPDGREIYWIVTNANSGSLFTGRAVRLDNSADLHVTKDCSAYTGAAGAYCTIKTSNLAVIKVGSKVFY